MAAFKQRKYKRAQGMFAELARRFPESATVLVRSGDAYLFEFKSGSKHYVAAADKALSFYAKADALHRKGCSLPDEPHYYLYMGQAFAFLRKDDFAEARRLLEDAQRRWPKSAEISYNLARAHCLAQDIAACAASFERTLLIARSLRRPRFLRTHRSYDEWVRRSRTQSEFPALREDPRYQQVIARAKKLPIAGDLPPLPTGSVVRQQAPPSE